MKRERRLARVARERAFRENVVAGERNGCLYCRRSDGGFTTVEHPLPESLGNTEVVLPNGVACDRCNNGVLSDLDQALTEFFPLKLRRTMLGVRSKAGKVPETRFRDGSLRHTGDGSLFFELHTRKSKSVKETDLGDGRVLMNFHVSGGKRITPGYCSALSRALLKASLACAWLDHGAVMLDPHYDHVRDAVLGKPRDGWLAMARSGDPHHGELELVYWLLTRTDGQRFLAVVAALYGVALATDSLRPEPDFPLSDDHATTVMFRREDFRAAA